MRRFARSAGPRSAGRCQRAESAGFGGGRCRRGVTAGAAREDLLRGAVDRYGDEDELVLMLCGCTRGTPSEHLAPSLTSGAALVQAVDDDVVLDARRGDRRDLPLGQAPSFVFDEILLPAFHTWSLPPTAAVATLAARRKRPGPRPPARSRGRAGAAPPVAHHDLRPRALVAASPPRTRSGGSPPPNDPATMADTSTGFPSSSIVVTRQTDAPTFLPRASTDRTSSLVVVGPVVGAAVGTGLALSGRTGPAGSWSSTFPPPVWV